MEFQSTKDAAKQFRELKEKIQGKPPKDWTNEQIKDIDEIVKFVEGKGKILTGELKEFATKVRDEKNEREQNSSKAQDKQPENQEKKVWQKPAGLSVKKSDHQMSMSAHDVVPVLQSYSEYLTQSADENSNSEEQENAPEQKPENENPQSNEGNENEENSEEIKKAKSLASSMDDLAFLYSELQDLSENRNPLSKSDPITEKQKKNKAMEIITKYKETESKLRQMPKTGLSEENRFFKASVPDEVAFACVICYMDSKIILDRSLMKHPNEKHGHQMTHNENGKGHFSVHGVDIELSQNELGAFCGIGLMTTEELANQKVFEELSVGPVPHNDIYD